MIELRKWQREAIEAALKKFRRPFSHFLCLATPGAGKTVMASTLADMLLREGKVDLVLCLSPSTIVANDFKVALEAITKKRFCGGLGAFGASLTYQSLRYLDTAFWMLFTNFRIFVIFDEIHHCAGDGIENSNAWGEQILMNIRGKAHYSIALTGTPWRSDTIPITLAEYMGEDKKIQLDYRYSLTQAINDGVCRVPHITLLDNELISVIKSTEKSSFSSIEAFLRDSKLTYFSLISNDKVIRQILEYGISRLNSEREKFANAGGLIVAASVAHAKYIRQLLHELGESSELVTYQRPEPERLIQKFKDSNEKWIISIGMISEGTNIPRLRVCCYLSLITTELYFRQVLGRVLRAQQLPVERGYLIIPAHPRLLEYSKRLAADIPHFSVCKSGRNNEVIPKYSNQLAESDYSTRELGNEKLFESKEVVKVLGNSTGETLNSWYNSTIDSFGRFQEQIFTL